MKPKTFILFVILSFLFVGCTYQPYQTREELLVSKVLKSQQALYSGDPNTQPLVSSYILYHDNSTIETDETDAILSIKLHVGNLTLSGYDYGRYLLSDVLLDFDVDRVSKEYIYDYEGYIYDAYHDRYYFSTTLPFVGNNYTNPHKGVMQIIGTDERLVVSIIDSVRVDIAVYDNYDSYHDRVIHTTWRALGF